MTKFNDRDEMEKFFESYRLTTVTQEKSRKSEQPYIYVNKASHKEITGPDGFTCKCYQTFKG